jgi:hypothetical protein
MLLSPSDEKLKFRMVMSSRNRTTVPVRVPSLGCVGACSLCCWEQTVVVCGVWCGLWTLE